MPRPSSVRTYTPCVHGYRVESTRQREEAVPLPRPARGRKATSRVYRPTVKGFPIVLAKFCTSDNSPSFDKHLRVSRKRGFFETAPCSHKGVLVVDCASCQGY